MDKEIDTTELPEISDREMTFFLNLIKGMRGTDAYRDAFEVSGWKNESIQCNASKLKTSAKGKQWLAALRQTQFDVAGYTLAKHLEDLADAAEFARQKGNAGALTQALTNMGKAAGHYTDKVEITQGQSIDDLFTRISNHVQPNKGETKH